MPGHLVHFLRSDEFWENFITGDLGWKNPNLTRKKSTSTKTRKLQLLFLFDQWNIQLFKHILKNIRLPTCAILISNMFEASVLPYPYGLLTNGQQWVPFYVVLVSRNLRKKHVQRPEQWPQPWLLAMRGWYYSVKIGILISHLQGSLLTDQYNGMPGHTFF